MSKRFEREVLIRFHHCDPAGVAFYPEYFVLFNELVEDWFNEGLDISFASFHMRDRLGFPVARIESNFCSPAKVGERLRLRLCVKRVGRTSITLKMDATGNTGELRVEAIFVVVLTNLDQWRPVPITGDLLQKLQSYIS